MARRSYLVVLLGWHEFLDSPIEHLGDEDLPRRCNCDSMRARELARSASGCAETAKNPSGVIQFQDLRRLSVSHIDMLIGRYEQTIGMAYPRPFGAEISIGIKNLDASVFPIANIDAAL